MVGVLLVHGNASLTVRVPSLSPKETSWKLLTVKESVPMKPEFGVQVKFAGSNAAVSPMPGETVPFAGEVWTTART